MEMKSFREQLMAIRPQVEAASEERKLVEHEEKEKTKDKLTSELKRLSAETLFSGLREIEDRYKTANKHFYPASVIQKTMNELIEFKKKIDRYVYYSGRFKELFTPAMLRTCDSLQRGIGELADKIQPQWDEWESMIEYIESLDFRTRKKGDEPKLVEASKVFYQRAHGIQLDIPSKLFASKKDNFFVVSKDQAVVGHFEAFPDEKRIVFVVAPQKGINFIKLVRGTVHRFCTRGPIELPKGEVNVRVYSREEVKFYNDLGFIRTKTLDMSDWLYNRKL